MISWAMKCMLNIFFNGEIMFIYRSLFTPLSGVFLSCKIYKRQEEYPVFKHLFSALFYKLYSSSLQAMPPHPALTVRGPLK